MYVKAFRVIGKKYGAIWLPQFETNVYVKINKVSILIYWYIYTVCNFGLLGWGHVFIYQYLSKNDVFFM